jgi:hypothetical protein
MSLQTAIGTITKLTERMVVHGYAIAEAVAALNYIQPTFMEGLDILVSVGDFETHQSGLICLRLSSRHWPRWATPSAPMSDI